LRSQNVGEDNSPLGNDHVGTIAIRIGNRISRGADNEFVQIVIFKVLYDLQNSMKLPQLCTLGQLNPSPNGRLITDQRHMDAVDVPEIPPLVQLAVHD